MKLIKKCLNLIILHIKLDTNVTYFTNYRVIQLKLQSKSEIKSKIVGRQMKLVTKSLNLIKLDTIVAYFTDLNNSELIAM